MATVTFNEVIKMVTIHCANCNALFAMTEDLNKRLRETSNTFYCPYGHENYYGEGNSEKDKLKRELQEKERQLIQAANNNLQKEQEIKKITRQLNRVKKGICPCCNRTFTDLQRHMQTKHPDKL